MKIPTGDINTLALINVYGGVHELIEHEPELTIEDKDSAAQAAVATFHAELMDYNFCQDHGQVFPSDNATPASTVGVKHKINYPRMDMLATTIYFAVSRILDNVPQLTDRENLYITTNVTNAFVDSLRIK